MQLSKLNYTRPALDDSILQLRRILFEGNDIFAINDRGICLVDYSATIFDPFQQILLSEGHGYADVALARDLQHSLTKAFSDKTVEDAQRIKDTFLLTQTQSRSYFLLMEALLVGLESEKNLA